MCTRRSPGRDRAMARLRQCSVRRPSATIVDTQRARDTKNCSRVSKLWIFPARRAIIRRSVGTAAVGLEPAPIVTQRGE